MMIEAQVMQAFEGLVAASKALDAERYMAFIDRGKFSGLGADGKAWHSARDLEAIVVPGFAAVEEIEKLEFFNVKVTAIDPSTAVLVNEYRQTIRLRDRQVIMQAGGGTQVWSHTGDGWKLVSISASDASARDAAVF